MNQVQNPEQPAKEADQPAPGAVEIELRAELEALYLQYEDVIGRANELTFQVEIAHLEFTQIFDAVGDAILVIDNDHTLIRINRAGLSFLNAASPDAVVGKKCHDLLREGVCRQQECPLRSRRKDRSRIERDLHRNGPDGTGTPYHMTVTPLYGLSDEVIGIVIQFKDITERKEYEKKLESANRELSRQATVDGLTQIANRRHFDERLAAEWARMRREGRPLSLILGDVDFFKRYNDHYGHQQGDECLKAVARTLRSCARRPADLAARYGGEEFALILPGIPVEGALFVAERIRFEIAAAGLAHARSEVSDRVTLSLGVTATAPRDSDLMPEDLLKSADDALYRAKAEGRNRAVAMDMPSPA